MAGSKRSASEEKELKATVKKLRLRLDKAETKADRWKKEAGRLRVAAERSERQVKKLSKRLEKASRSAEPSDGQSTESFEPAVSGPNDGWTVAELRAEARSRGLTGISRKSKAELLTALT